MARHACRLSCYVKKLRKRGIGLTAVPKTRFCRGNGAVGGLAYACYCCVRAASARRCKWIGIPRFKAVEAERPDVLGKLRVGGKAHNAVFRQRESAGNG